jgi:hypothetical protein
MLQFLPSLALNRPKLWLSILLLLQTSRIRIGLNSHLLMQVLSRLRINLLAAAPPTNVGLFRRDVFEVEAFLVNRG